MTTSDSKIVYDPSEQDKEAAVPRGSGSKYRSAQGPMETTVTAGGATFVFQRGLDRLAEADPGNVLQIGASQIQMLGSYHEIVLDQARLSFRWALIAAAIGLVFFLIAIGFVLYAQAVEVAVISVIGGALIEFISAINFYLYGKTALQMAEFQERLERMQRFLIANSLCESLEGDLKHESRSQLIRTIAEIREEPQTKEADGKSAKQLGE